MTTQARELAKLVNNSGDLNLVDDITLGSDGALLNFGADSDVVITHVADTGLLLNSSRQLQFGDSGTYISQSADGVLQLTSDTEVEINATTVDINANVDISGNLVLGGDLTVNGSTTTVNSTNTTIDDNLLELNSGASSNANDSGIIIERGSTGDNAIMFWDESADEWVVGTTSATADGTGNISHTKADFEAATIRGTSADFISTGIADVITVSGTDDGAGEGPDIVIKRNSASPADDDILGALVFKGENDADQVVTYGKIRTRILDVTDGEEDGQLEFMAETAGVITSLAKLDSTGLYLNQNLGLLFEGDGVDAHELKLVAADGLSGDVTVTLPGATDTLVGKATTDTLTNKTLTSPVLNTGVSGTAIKDEDNLASDSDTHLATQQSIKAYVDTKAVLSGSTNNQITTVTGAHAIQGESNLTFDGSTLAVTGAVTISGASTLDGVTITDNTISTNASNSPLELKANGTGAVKVVSGGVTFTLPTADGSAGQALVTDGAGTLSFDSVSTTISDDTLATVRNNKHLGTQARTIDSINATFIDSAFWFIGYLLD